MKPDLLTSDQAIEHSQIGTSSLKDGGTVPNRAPYQMLVSSSLKRFSQQIDKFPLLLTTTGSEPNDMSACPQIRECLTTGQVSIERQIAKYLATAKEDNGMTLTGLQQLAKAIGVFKTENITSESALIRLIQKASHHKPCYRTRPNELCTNTAHCQWRDECQKLVAEWQR